MHCKIIFENFLTGKKLRLDFNIFGTLNQVPIFICWPILFRTNRKFIARREIREKIGKNCTHFFVETPACLFFGKWD